VDVPILAGVTTREELTDGDYLLVAAVAGREGWTDLRRPVTVADRPRTVAEQAAVLRYAAAIPPERLPSGWDPRRARLFMLALGAVGLVACWLVSPERTALGLIVVGLFCLVGLRKRSRTAPALHAPRRGALRPF
jgi:hypothetical protein